MAKKAVATLHEGMAKNVVKCIRMDKSPRTGAYIFTERVVPTDKVKDFFDKK
ncbi:MAG: DUF4295 domain-containing protein [Bacteroidales bacterium]|jgi:hypothetical protein